MIPQLISRLEKIVTEEVISIGSMDEDSFSKPLGPGKWNKKEILGHLIDSAQNNIQRFIRGQYDQEPEISYNQNEWVDLNNYRNDPSQEIIRLWELLNKRIISIMKKMPETKYGNICRIKGEPHSVEFLFEDYISHLNHHLEQIHSNN